MASLRRTYKRIILVVFCFAAFCSASATNYYFDSTSGNDDNDGFSPSAAWKTFSNISSLNINAGDSLLLRCGSLFGQQLALTNIRGTSTEPVYIGKYGSGNNPKITPSSGKAILINDCSFLIIRDLEITKQGVDLQPIQSGTIKYFDGIILENLYIHDVTGQGISLNYIHKGIYNSKIRDCIVRNCRIEGTIQNGIVIEGGVNASFIGNNMDMIGQNGFRIDKSNGVTIRGNVVNRPGRITPAGDGGYVLACNNVLIERNTFKNARGDLDATGFHIDVNNRNVIVQYNLSINNEGGFVEILGNNHNCTFRYNISVNDGSRVKGEINSRGDKNINDGHTLFVTGFKVDQKHRDDDYFEGPYNNYIYNNTIYVKDDITSTFDLRYTVDGLLIMNNIFHLTGPTKDVTGGRKERELPGTFPQRIVFKNNLYIDNSTLPSNMLMDDSQKLIGDVGFVNGGGGFPEDYIPQNMDLVKDKGMFIEIIPGDDIGIVGGLMLLEDILGNPIIGTPDLGAIEVSQVYYPYASAGSDKSFNFIPDSVIFEGVALDDSLIVSQQWEKLSGPSCSLVTVDSLQLVVKELEEGEYTFRLTVTDNEGNTASDEVKLTIFCEFCHTPEVSVSSDRIIQLPQDTVLLQGSATVEYGSVASYLWEKVSGPGVAISGAETAEAVLENLGEGVYVFRLTATSDAGFSASDEVTVTVLGAPEYILKSSTELEIDGALDSSWCSPLFTLDNLVKGFANIASKGGFLYDEDHLYVYVEVEDGYLMHDSGDEWWHDDAVEVYIDADNSKGTTYDSNDFRYGFRWHWTVAGMDMFEAVHGATEGVEWKMIEVSGGYRLEAAFPWTTLNHAPGDGDEIGLEIRVLNDDDGSVNDAIKAKFGFSGEQVPVPSQFGTMVLEGACPAVTRVNEAEGNRIRVYPTLTDGVVYIESVNLEEFTCKVFCITGAAVRVKQFIGSSSMSLFELPAGIYFLRLEGIETITTIRITKST